MDLLLYIGIFWSGCLFGIFLCWWFILRMKSYSGIIVAKQNEIEDKVMYSLILFDDPANLRFENEVMFKVQTSEEEADRE